MDMKNKKINEKKNSEKRTKRITVEVPKVWVDMIDDVCNKSFAPRRTWVTNAIYKNLVSEGLLPKEDKD
jgi:hypothetical protein